MFKTATIEILIDDKWHDKCFFILFLTPNIISTKFLLKSVIDNNLVNNTIVYGPLKQDSGDVTLVMLLRFYFWVAH
jgi:hypothetical protein